MRPQSLVFPLRFVLHLLTMKRVDPDARGMTATGEARMKEPSRAPILKLLAWIVLFVILGTPLVAFLWETLNALLTGHFDALQIAISVPVLALFYGLLLILARFIEKWDAGSSEFAHPAPAEDPISIHPAGK